MGQELSEEETTSISEELEELHNDTCKDIVAKIVEALGVEESP